MNESTTDLTAKLEALLAEGFAAQGDGLAAKLCSVAGDLPEDLRDMLAQLAQGSGTVDAGGAVPFAFRCGLAHERLEALAQQRLAANVAFLGTDGTPAPELEKADYDALARFVRWRDHALKTVADYTLKFLLVSAVLLVLGLSLGLI
ncbi:MAG: hypothetical protein ACKN9T_06210 [Candidatus Methylumidiphilus sp.]